jgi:hypothetical protein
MSNELHQQISVGWLVSITEYGARQTGYGILPAGTLANALLLVNLTPVPFSHFPDPRGNFRFDQFNPTLLFLCPSCRDDPVD